MRYLPLLLLLLISCKQQTKSLSAQEIIDKTIERSGGNKYDDANIRFSFRDVAYTSHRKNGIFKLTRTTIDSLGREIKDVLSNSGFIRYQNSEKVELVDSIQTKFSNSLNSVHYFVQLPYGLNDEAVQKELFPEVEIKDEQYYSIKVTFKKEGGGIDHDDIYMYWINKKDFTVDYFAYKFYSGQGGIRFREAYNLRTIGGIRFVDYKNYKIEPWREVALEDLPSLFNQGRLEFLSDIRTENITVE